jgi:hypothetical protein
MAQDPRYTEAMIPPPQEVSSGNPFGDEIDEEDDFPRAGQGYKIPDYSDGGTYEDVFSGQSTDIQNAQYEQYPRHQEFAEPDFEADFEQKGDLESEVGTSVTTGTTSTSQEKKEEPKDLHIWNIEYYSCYFNVDTTEVGLRMLRSVVPFSVNFFSSIENNPDLYGPFWIATTLIFVIAAAGNFADWLHDRDNFHYHFEAVSFAAGAIYGYVVIVPLLLWLAFRWLSVRVSLLQNLCIYGYSLFIFIPIAILCIIPINLVRWCIISGATALSVLFLLMNFYPPLLKNGYEESRQQLLAGLVTSAIIALLHLGLALTFKLYFFDYPE